MFVEEVKKQKMTKQQDRAEKIIKDKIGTEKYLKTRKHGITDEQLLHYYHELNQDAELLEQRLETLFQTAEHLFDNIDQQIQNLKTQINKLENLKKGITQDIITEEKQG